MSKALKTIAVIILVYLAIATTVAIVKTAIDNTKTEQAANISQSIQTKEGYLERVRQNNPEYPELMTCIYGQYIDKHGLEETLKMDMQYYNADNLPEPLQAELTEMGANC